MNLRDADPVGISAGAVSLGCESWACGLVLYGKQMELQCMACDVRQSHCSYHSNRDPEFDHPVFKRYLMNAKEKGDDYLPASLQWR